MKTLFNINRHISLYYGSMNIRACLMMIISVIKGLFISQDRNRKRLSIEIQKSFNSHVGVYTFTSARGAIAAFLNVSGAKNRDVLMSSYTCLAVPTAVIFSGANPNYLDISASDLNMNIFDIPNKINSNTHTIIAQHTLGNVVEIKRLRNIINCKDVFILEDCALSSGTRLRGQMLGADGDASIHSLELSKTITVGWGGILVITNKELKERMDIYYQSLEDEKTFKSLRKALQTILSGISYHPVLYNYFGKYILYFGYKYKFFMVSTPENEQYGLASKDFITRLHGIQANFANYQWKMLRIIGEKSHENFNIISDHLKTLGYIHFCPSETHFYVSPRVPFLVSNPIEAMNFFSDNGVELGRWFEGPLSPEPKSDLFNYSKNNFPNAGYISKYIVNLPCHSRLSKSDLTKLKNLLYLFSDKYPKSKILDML